MRLDQENLKSAVNRRSFLKNAGTATAAVAAMGVAAPKTLFAATPTTPLSPDSPTEIFTAALVAEDLAITFYYNALIGGVIQDPNLAGPGGTALNVTPSGDNGNVQYLRGALHEEIIHSNLFRVLLGRGEFSFAQDPYTSFYLPTGSLDSLNVFVALLQALENAFIAAYMAAVQEFALLAAVGKPMTFNGVTYQPSDFVYFAGVASSIMGVEAEHRALGRSISPQAYLANQLNYEQQLGIFTVYNGKTSAVAALTPFLTPGEGKTEYSLITAYGNAHTVSDTAYGSMPTKFFT
ncbi:hypothetical protein ACPOL_2464 [Acidisarcina polymorpha]|uniref:Dessication-associated protein n=1 Tax=Acidisarcina polymorpha TaxID=2211140 RepID=A0A2Z5FZJ1_9BACT|nr:ferritin-like domain-containing protein [Acidisarcina polymorpha]AXC11786.1 hypothetical protein ACPOL_2464 [Acidisarcina polymorpha]